MAQLHAQKKVNKNIFRLLLHSNTIWKGK